MSDVEAAFDTLAPAYDRTFTDTTLGRLLRTAVWEQLEEVFSAGDLVLELGCGTGEDAVWLAGRGIRVCATDAAPAMLDIVHRKADAREVAGNVAVARVDISETTADTPPPRASAVGLTSSAGRYDGVLANFGALNCVERWKPLAEGLSRVVRPSGRVVVVVMGPFCPWDWFWFLLRGRPHQAFRRFRAGAPASLGEGARQRVWYPTPRRLRRAFEGSFIHRTTNGIGVLLPPTYGKHLVERWEEWFRKVAAWDQRLGRVFPGTWLNDHYLMVLERK